MLKAVTSATFEYRNHIAVARKMVDSLTGKFFCWQGRFDGNESTFIVSRTLEAFERNFIALADKVEEQPATPVAEQVEHYGIEPEDEAGAYV